MTLSNSVPKQNQQQIEFSHVFSNEYKPNTGLTTVSPFTDMDQL